MGVQGGAILSPSVHERRSVYVPPAFVGLPWSTARRKVPPISTEGVSASAASGTSPHFSDPGSTTMALCFIAADFVFADFAGALVWALAVQADSTSRVNSTILCRAMAAPFNFEFRC